MVAYDLNAEGDRLGLALGYVVVAAIDPDDTWDGLGRALWITHGGAAVGTFAGVAVTCKAWEDITLPEELSVNPRGESDLVFSRIQSFWGW